MKCLQEMLIWNLLCLPWGGHIKDAHTYPKLFSVNSVLMWIGQLFLPFPSMYTIQHYLSVVFQPACKSSLQNSGVNNQLWKIFLKEMNKFYLLVWKAEGMGKVGQLLYVCSNVPTHISMQKRWNIRLRRWTLYCQFEQDLVYENMYCKTKILISMVLLQF